MRKNPSAKDHSNGLPMITIDDDSFDEIDSHYLSSGDNEPFVPPY
jgi:hypothetical protein